MFRILQPLFAMLASSSDQTLRQTVEYLRAENRILREKLPKQIPITSQERARLVRLGSALGGAIKSVITIVSYRTFCRWAAGEDDGTRTKRRSPRKPGRPRTADETRELVLQLARENGWGYTRILGELRKLGVRGVCRSTVVNILKEASIDPGPRRGEGTWADFVKRHAATLWASDFLSVRSHTAAGVVDLYLLVFIHVGTRRVIVSAPTANPDSAWVAQQARNASMQIAEWNLSVSHLIVDHDTKFTESFDEVFQAEGAEVMRVGPRAPNMNPHVERFIQSLRQECLDHFVICGERHLHHLVTNYLAYYLEDRPHQGVGNVPLPDTDPGKPRILPFPSGEVKCRRRLGGLLKHYYRAAA